MDVVAVRTKECGGRTRPLRAAAFVVSALGLAGALLSTGSVAAAARSGRRDVTITLYNGQHEQTTDALVAKFEKLHPQIHVAMRSDDEDTLDAQIAQEGSRSPADVIFTENSPALQFLQQKGLLAKLDGSTLARTPARYDSARGDWVGVAARVSVLVYNPSLISKSALPKTVLQMASPKYKGKIAFAAGESDFQPIVTGVLRADGKAKTLAWLEGLKANAGDHIVPDDQTIAEDVNDGRVAFGVINQYYWYRLRAQIGASATVAKITYFAPRDPGYVLDVSTAGVLKSSRHRAAAQSFVAFLVSKQGQEAIDHSVSYEYPIASGVRMTRHETPFDDLKPNPITLGQLGTGGKAIALLRQVQLL